VTLCTLALAAALGTVVVATGARPQPVPEADADRGRDLYRAQCAVCHDQSGAGRPPRYPALDGNERLQDVTHLVRVVRRGRGGMPPFPRLGAEDIAAIATHVRTAWGNRFGSVTVDQVRTALRGLETETSAASLPAPARGWYTEDQASRGRTSYMQYCAACHGADFVPDDFSSGLTGAAFDWRFKGRSVFDLFETIRTRMPPDAAGSLDPETTVEIVAYLLQANGFSPGSTPLAIDPARLEALPLTRPRP
jgi:mono/diheme cytochrome c family protein